MHVAGVAMDDLVYICTKIARQMDADGLDRVFEAAQAATLAIEDGRPLLARAIELADEVCLHPEQQMLCLCHMHAGPTCSISWTCGFSALSTRLCALSCRQASGGLPKMSFRDSNSP